MELVITILLVLLMICGGAIGELWAQNRRLQAERDVARIRAGAWDWTKEDERRAHAALAMICDKCREPYRCSQDELDAECALCPVPDAVYRLAAGAEGRIATAVRALPRNDSEEARG